MKVVPIRAYKSNDGCIWETEAEAIVQNIEECFGKSELSHGDSYSSMQEKLRIWFKDHKKDVRYILKNIDKI